MTKEKKEIKNITAGLIFSWFFGVIFLFSGIGLVAQGSYITGLLIVICSIMIIPYFSKIFVEKFNFQISGGVKVLLVIVIFILIAIGGSTSEDLNPNVTVQPTNNVANQQNSEPIQNIQEIPSKQKVKSATISIDRVQIQVANLYPTRITVTNTGDVSISPKFDLYVYDDNDNEVCSGSPMFDEIGSILAGQKETGEISMMGCMFSEDGTYDLQIDLLDDDYNKLDTTTKDFSVDYWDQFKI